MKAVSVALFVLWLSATGAYAQKACDQYRSSITTGALGIIEKVAAVPGKRIYLCGYVIIRASGGQDLEFELTTGGGTNCATNKTTIIPRMDIPISGLVNRNPYVGEFTPQGQAVCLQTWGNGSVTSIFYWAQF